jgi:carbonic anhydrase/acetyltransferase-like protein (isoleucine patch superfamily)
MPIYALGDMVPSIHPDAWVHPDAVIIGDVEIGADSTVWPCAVLRGDNGGIVIGARTSIQDGTVIHCIPTGPTVVGDECVVGHIVHLEGCTIESNSLVGNGSVVLHNAIVRSGSLVGSNAVVPNGMEVPSGMMALGVPAKLRPATEGGKFSMEIAVEDYVTRGRLYRESMRRLD